MEQNWNPEKRGKEMLEYRKLKLYEADRIAENTIAFYKKLGCMLAAERNQRLYEEDPRDIQLEYHL